MRATVASREATCTCAQLARARRYPPSPSPLVLIGHAASLTPY